MNKPSQAPVVRPYREADFDALVKLWNDCGLVRPWNDPGADVARCLATPGSDLLVSEMPAGAGLVASVMFGNDGHRGWLYYVAVAPQQRRRGYGVSMVRAAEAALAEAGAVKIMLMIRPDNQPAIAFYANLGYRIEERALMAHWLKPEQP